MYNGRLIDRTLRVVLSHTGHIELERIEMRRSIRSNRICGSVALLAVTAVYLVSGQNQARGQLESTDIVDTAVAAGDFDTLLAAVKAAGLAQTLKSQGPFTVFAPTEEAFKSLPKGTLESLLKPENKEQLKAILTYHVVPDRVSAREAYGLNNAATVNGQRLDITRRDGKLVIGEAKIVATDVNCSNGVIHVIDRVLLPEESRIPAVAEKAGQFSTLLAAVSAAGLAEVLDGEGPFTVFAPTDDAFKALPKGTVETLLKPENKQKLVDILKYHVVSGRVYADQAAEAGRATTLLGSAVETAVSADGLRINDSLVIKGGFGDGQRRDSRHRFRASAAADEYASGYADSRRRYPPRGPGVQPWGSP